MRDYLRGIFLLKGLFMPFSLGEVCLSFGEMLFSFENVLVTPQKYPRIFIIILLYISGMN